MPKQTKWQDWDKAIEKVLSESPEPLHYEEITARVLEQGLVQNMGPNPTKSVSNFLYYSTNSKDSKYEKVGRGIFRLRLQGSPPTSDGEQEEEEKQYKVISSYGIFWEREKVDWSSKVQLLGIQANGDTPVDFHAQRGIYLLYDRREIIYVGRATEGTLGQRLHRHTKDRLSGRWDRFSWFGLLPVSEKGNLDVALPQKYESKYLIPAFEAVLIEALEPRQNRQQGEGLAAVEYLQYVDPGFENRRLAQAVLK